MNLYQYYEQKNTADKPAAVRRTYQVVDTICKTKVIDNDMESTLEAADLSTYCLAEALVVLHLVAESRKNDYLVLKEKYDRLTDTVNEQDI